MRAIKATRFPIVLLALFAVSAGAQTGPCAPTVTGTLEIVSFTSRLFQNTRNLRVWLPPGYKDAANASQTYPVLYMLDARSLFDKCTSSNGEWQIDETLTRLIAQRAVPPLIVVGIDALPGEGRGFEYLPYKDTISAPTSPEPNGKRFPDFLAADALPFIASRYRVKGPPYGIGGSSYGAVAALYALLARSDLFDLGLLESPSLQIGNGQLLRDTQFLAKCPSRTFIGVGTTEYSSDAPDLRNRGFVGSARQLEANLKSCALNEAAVRLVVQPGGTHDPKSWGSRFAEAIQFLYGSH